MFARFVSHRSAGVSVSVFALACQRKLTLRCSVAAEVSGDDIVAIWILDRLFTVPSDQHVVASGRSVVRSKPIHALCFAGIPAMF